MLFGEYELSPSLIGLSLLPTPHPEAFQRLSVRPSIPRYRDFSLDMGRSLGFASAAGYCAPSSDSLSLRVRASSRLASQPTATRRFIMQKARRHHKTWLRPLVGAWFQGLFHSPARGAFHLSLTVLVHYRSPRVFSLGGWSRRIHAGFHVPRATQDTGRLRETTRTGLSPSAAALSSALTLASFLATARSYNPREAWTSRVWANPRSLATTWGITFCSLFLQVLRCFSSLRSPPATILPGDRPPDGRVAPFGNPGVKGRLRLTPDYRSLPRPSSPCGA